MTEANWKRKDSNWPKFIVLWVCFNLSYKLNKCTHRIQIVRVDSYATSWVKGYYGNVYQLL